MSDYATLALLAGFVFLYGLVSGRLDRSPFGGALLFIAVGLACGPSGIGLLSLDVDAGGVRRLAELALGLVLFTDAAEADLAVLRRAYMIPERLLAIGLPLTIGLGTVTAMLIFDSLAPLEAAILAVVVAPTDAALGKAVVTDRAVPAPVREGLTVESGLNDGICVPVLFTLLALLAAETELGPVRMLARHALEEIGVGAAVGVGLSLIAAPALHACIGRGWITGAWRQMPVVSLALACFAGAQALGGSGFIAAFTGGLAFGWLARRRKHAVLSPAEAAGDVVALLTWVVFGATLVGPLIAALSWRAMLFAVLALTLLRIGPVWIALAGSGLAADTRLFVGWFGPRGLATIVFVVMVLDTHLPGGGLVAEAAGATVLLSVLLHGLTAAGLSAAYGRQASGRGGLP